MAIQPQEMARSLIHSATVRLKKQGATSCLFKLSKNYATYVAKTNILISCTFLAQLSATFVFQIYMQKAHFVPEDQLRCIHEINFY